MSQLSYLPNLLRDDVVAKLIIGDEHVFSTFFAALLQGLDREENPVPIFSQIVSEHFSGFTVDEADMASINFQDQERIMKLVEQLRAQFGEKVTVSYVRDFLSAAVLYRTILKSTMTYQFKINALRKIAADLTAEEQYRHQELLLTQNLNRLQDCLNLSIPETRLLEVTFLLSTNVRTIIFRDFTFGILKSPALHDHFYRLLVGADIPEQIALVDAAFAYNSRLIVMGIINYDDKTKRLGQLSDFWTMTLTGHYPNDEKFFSNFTFELVEKKRSFSGAIAKAASAHDEKLLRDLLEFVVLKNEQQAGLVGDELGLNVLLYGSSNLDKHGYVFNLLKKWGVTPYQLRSRDASAVDLPGICYVAQRYLSLLFARESKTPILIVNKAEDALSRRSNRSSMYVAMFGPEEDDPKLVRTSDNELLIDNPVPTIWMTSYVDRIADENVGRMLMHLELKGGSRRDRREEVQKICTEHGFSENIAQQLSMYHQLNSEQVKAAARATEIMGLTDQEGEDALIHLIGNSQRALGREKTEELRASVTTYDLDLLNLAGSIKPDRIIEAFKKKQMGTLCLYGLPGTGKTAFAEHLAMQLDLSLIIKPASELLNMYVGETEKNIAKMFSEARSEGAILLLDEADSFLRDRAAAMHSWEVTQVNELLQRMERFPGIFICATNLFHSLDAAALRRFTFKLEFRALTEEQRMKMLVTEAGIDLEQLSDKDRDDLWLGCQLIHHLTPGDFATVKRQITVFDEKITPKQWLERLEIEAKAKLVGLLRNSGYGQEVTTTLKPPV